ncbi:hypothetical protein D3C72_1928440 [compost metagenome]
MRTRGGTSHKGIDTTKATKAKRVELSDQATLAIKEPPFLRSSVGKRRSATNATSAGVISTATTSNESTTSSGVIAKTTIRGATTVVTSPTPQPCSQLKKPASSVDASSNDRMPCTAASQ